MRRRWETLKKLYSAIFRTKIECGCQIYNTASAGSLKKLESIHREGIRIYTRAFRTSPVESLHVEAIDPPGTKKKQIGTKIPVYKLKSNSSYRETVNTLDNNENQNCKENERSIKLTGVYLTKLEWRYIGEQI